MNPHNTAFVPPWPGAVLCPTCRWGWLERRRVRRFNGILVLAGYVILIPSLFMTIAMLVSLVRLAGHPDSDAGGMALGIIAAMTAMAFGSGALGWFLISRKPALVCSRCGVSLPAA